MYPSIDPPYETTTPRLAAIVGSLLTVCGAFLIGMIAYLAWSLNASELAAERSRVDNAFDQSIASVLDQQRSVAWWDDAVIKITRNFDPEFVESNFGLFLTETYSQDEVFILDTENRPVYSHFDDRPTSENEIASHLEQVSQVVQGVRNGGRTFLKRRPDVFLDRQVGYDKLGGVRTSAGWFSAILPIDGKPSIVTAITISPNVDQSLIAPTPFLLVSIVNIDQAYLDSIGRSLLIPSLRLEPTDPRSGNMPSQPFVMDDGQIGGYLTWTSSKPGRPLLTTVLPLVVLFVVTMGALSARMLRRLTGASDKLVRQAAAASHDASHDSLSSLPNRSAFGRHVDALRSASLQEEGSVILAGYLDIDRFKEINDTLGHRTGDRLIREFGLRLRSSLLADDFLARVGGDEFAILRYVRPAVEKKSLDLMLNEALATPIAVDGHEIAVTASMGLAEMPRHGGTSEELMRNADIALYQAKARGRNQTVAFSEEMAEEMVTRRRIELHLANAVELGQLELHYQPIVDSCSGLVSGAEALLRWSHPELGPVPPAVFIPVAEEAGLMPKIGEWVFREAIRQSMAWPHLDMAINLSPAQFRHVDVETQLADILRTTSADPGRIVLEITEGLLLDPSPRTRRTLDALRRSGFRVALDDFGTGYSSLGYLVEFGFDKLKIDRSFVSGMADTESAKTIVRSVVQMGHALGMEVVAEGVETQSEEAVMRTLGCDQMQGYLFSRPLAPAAFIAFVTTYNADARRERDKTGVLDRRIGS